MHVFEWTYGRVVSAAGMMAAVLRELHHDRQKHLNMQLDTSIRFTKVSYTHATSSFVFPLDDQVQICDIRSLLASHHVESIDGDGRGWQG